MGTFLFTLICICSTVFFVEWFHQIPSGDNMHYRGFHTYTDAEKELSFKRYYDYQCRKYSSIRLKLNKINERTMNYIKRIVCDRLDRQKRSHIFKVTDVYFSYTNFVERRLVVVIHHEDHHCTEAMYFL